MKKDAGSETENAKRKTKSEGKADTMKREEYTYRPAWRSFYVHIAAMVACLVLVALVSIKLTLDPAYQKAIWGFWVVFVLIVFGDMFLKRVGTTLIVRADEVACEKGILKRESIEIGMRSIRTVQVTQRIMQRILNIGDISIASSGTDNYEIRIPNMPSPHEIRNQIQDRERSQPVEVKPQAEESKAEA